MLQHLDLPLVATPFANVLAIDHWYGVVLTTTSKGTVHEELSSDDFLDICSYVTQHQFNFSSARFVALAVPKKVTELHLSKVLELTTKWNRDNKFGLVVDINSESRKSVSQLIAQANHFAIINLNSLDVSKSELALVVKQGASALKISKKIITNSDSQRHLVTSLLEECKQLALPVLAADVDDEPTLNLFLSAGVNYVSGQAITNSFTVNKSFQLPKTLQLSDVAKSCL